MTNDQEYETIVSSFVDGVKILVPKWFQTRRGREVPTPAFHYELEDLILAENRNGTTLYPRLAIRAPRGHAKSTIVSKGYNLWRILMSGCVEYLDEYIVLCSSNFKQSHNFFRSIINNLENNEKIRYYFGKPMRGSYWRYGDGDVVVMFRGEQGKREIRLRCSGADMEQRGDQEDNIRPTIVTLDDITRDRESRTESGREAVVDWVLSTIVPLLDPEGRIINVGTPRPYDDDWNAGIIEKLAAAGAENDARFADVETALDRWHLVTYRAIPDMADESVPVLWPERHSRATLLGLLEQAKSVGKEHLWWSENQCMVVSAGSKAFPREWYEPFRWDGRLVHHNAGPYLQVEGFGRVAINSFVGIDSAFSRARKADNTVISAWGMDEHRGWWQLERIKRRGMPTPEAVREAVLMGARVQAQYVMFEKVAAQAALQEFANEFQDELLAKGELQHIMEIKDYPPGNRASKEERIKSALQTPYGLGRVHHKQGLYHDIEKELDNFPAVHPDELDSSYYAFVESYPPSHVAPPEAPGHGEEARSYEVDYLTGVVRRSGRQPRTRTARAS